MNKLIFSINSIIIAGIISWFTIIMVLIGGNPEFAWELGFDRAVKFTFLMVSALILGLIGLKLFFKYRQGHRLSTFYLGSYNLIYCVGSVFEAMGNLMNFGYLLNDATDTIVYIMMMWAVIFFFLFLQEIFSGTSTIQEQKKMRILFMVFSIVSLLFLFSSPFTARLFSAIGTGIMVILFLLVYTWQISAASKLVKKADDDVMKAGLKMIALSGVIFIALILMVIVKSFVSNPVIEKMLDIGIPVAVLVSAIVTYMGYIYPSRK
ncbi:MAG: hypothetical protein ACTSUE_25490 [Promethearchaeota archaeon]